MTKRELLDARAHTHLASVIVSELRMLPGAPEPMWSGTPIRYPKKVTDCCSRSVTYGGEAKWSCHNYGRFLVRLRDRSYAVLCGQHLRQYAKRGWVQEDVARRLLIDDAESNRQRVSKRVSCLKKGACI